MSAFNFKALREQYRAAQEKAKKSTKRIGKSKSSTTLK